MFVSKVAAKLLTVFILSVTSVSIAFCAQATGTGGTLQGVVTDPSGAVVAGADITLSSPITGYSKVCKTDAGGNYRFANIPPHQYQLTVTVTGFQPFQQDVDVHTAVPQKVDLKLALAASTETVNVSATGDLVENVSAPHTDVNESLLASLPIANTGQGLSDAITLTSGGVVADSNGFFHPQGDHGEVTYNVDGQSISDQQNKAFSTQLPANAFQSLELVSSSPNAEFGDKTGLIVNATTRSGLGQRPTGSFDTYYGSFGTFGEDATFAIGGTRWGNFIVLDSNRSGRFLDSPEFAPIHDIGNTENIFDRADYQPGPHDSLHLNLSFARNWFQTPNTYDQLSQDQRQEAQTLSAALGYQHTFSPTTLLSINPFFRQDHVQYFPSADALNDNPATIAENRHLTNWGTRIDLSYASGIHNVKIGTQLMQTRLDENFGFALTDPLLNPVCLTAAGSAVAAPGILNPALCAGSGYQPNPGLSPGLLPYDLARGGSLFHFTGAANINQEAVYAQDQVTLKNLTLSLGVRFDYYSGISSDNLFEPRFGISYLIKKTSTVVRGSYDRTMETPYNENLVLSSATGSGGFVSNTFGAYGATALRPGHRNELSTGFEQSLGKYVQLSADYFWKFTQDAFDFDTLFNTPITFPIEWHQSKIDGVSARLSTRTIKGFQAYMTLGHTRARFFGPESGGLIFNSPLNTSVFRIDHDQEFQQTSYLRYQHGKDGIWTAFTWRFDSGEVAGAVTNLNAALALDGDQQATIGFYCGTQYATLLSPIKSCSNGYGATRLNIPTAGTFNPDHNPPRIAPRNIFDASVGTDNLFHKERFKTTLKFTALNLTNEASLYNFLSTFSGTHWVTPRDYQVTLGWSY